MREMALMQVNYVSAALLRRRGLSGKRGSDGANRDSVLPLILSLPAVHQYSGWAEA